MKARSSRSNTLPVGFIGEFMISSLVLGAESGGQLVARQAPIGRLEAHQLGNAAGAADDRQIGVVEAARSAPPRRPARSARTGSRPAPRSRPRSPSPRAANRLRAHRSAWHARPPPGAAPACPSSADIDAAPPPSRAPPPATRKGGSSPSGKALAEIDRAMLGGQPRITSKMVVPRDAKMRIGLHEVFRV